MNSEFAYEERAINWSRLIWFGLILFIFSALLILLYAALARGAAAVWLSIIGLYFMAQFIVASLIGRLIRWGDGS